MRISDIVRVRDAGRRVYLVYAGPRLRSAVIAPIERTPYLRSNERARTVLDVSELDAIDLSMAECRVLEGHASGAVMMPALWRERAARALGGR